MRNEKLKELTRYAVLIALTTVMTMVIHIPTPGTKGYLNLGDMVVFLAAMILGKKGGFIVGGLGSALADLLLGYTYYAPITFVVKGLEGFFAGALLDTKVGKKAPIIPTAIGGLWMAFGYFLAESFILKYGVKVSLASMPGNIAQGLFGAIVAVVLSVALRRTKVFDS